MSRPEDLVRDRLESHSPQRRTSWTATDLLAETFPDPRFAVVDLIPEGLAFMAGAPKLGKSWMGLGLGIAVAAGGRALGRIAVEPGPVLYLALEDGPRRLQSRLRTLLGPDTAPEGLHLETEWARLDAGGAERIDGWLEANPYARLVLIDVWPRIRPRTDRRTDHYQADYEAAAQLQALATGRGVAMVALYHTRKAEAEDFVETVQGTFGTAGAADTIIVVKRSRGQADATLYVTGRDVSERELALRFTPEAGTWDLLGDAAEYGLGETRRELLDAIRAHESLTPKQASEVSSVSYELAKKTLQRMANDGQLAAACGRYSLRTPVPGVPPSLGDAPLGDKGTEGTVVLEGVTDA
jgi:AAA domain